MKNHINIFILMLVISLGFISCSKEYKAKHLALKELKDTLNDWESYESVSWGNLDTLKTSPSADLKLDSLIYSFNLVSALVEDCRQKTNEAVTEGDNYRANKTYNTSMKLMKILGTITDSITLEGKRFKPKFIGYKMKHSFRNNNEFGGKVLKHVEFFFNKSLTKVDSMEYIKNKGN